MHQLKLLVLLFFLPPILANAQKSVSWYKLAFEEQVKMLKGQNPIDFKRAVFISENAYFQGKLDYVSFCDKLKKTSQKLTAFIKERGFGHFKTAGNWALFTYMTDSITINGFSPYSYDFDDFMGDNDCSKMFVTKLMRTKSGNCHSLPMYYKILCEEIGAKAHLALAPNHLYIKHIDENGQWTNLELTNGGFPRDQWIIKEMSITVEAIKNGIYMTPLSPKESIALTMLDLANNYRFQIGYDAFYIKAINTALAYFPTCIPLLMGRANYYKYIGEAESKKPTPNPAHLKNIYHSYKTTISKIDALGYKEMPADIYQQWVKSVEKEKRKRATAK